MRTTLALTLLAGTAAQSCPSLLPSSMAAGTAFQFKVPFTAEGYWQPYLELKDLNNDGAVLGKLQTLCPKIERTMAYTDSLTGGTLFTAITKLGIVSLASGNWGQTDVLDCNGQVATKITSSFSQSFLQKYGFQTDFTITSAGGTTIGGVSGSNIGNGYITVTNSSGYGVANIQWSWANRFSIINSYMTVTFLGNGSDLEQSGISPETVLTVAQLGYSRIALSSNAFADNCSRFLIVGLPVLCIINGIVLLCFLKSASNKVIGLLGALLFYPMLAYVFIVAAITSVICLLIKLPWILAQIMVTPLALFRGPAIRRSVDSAFQCLDPNPVMELGKKVMKLPITPFFKD